MKKYEKQLTVIIPFIVVFTIILGCGGTSNSSNVNNSENSEPENYAILEESQVEEEVEEPVVVDPRQTSVTPIEDFSYELDNGYALLKEYKGQDKIVHIASSYTVDGTYYVTNLSKFMVGIGKDVDTVVFDEGITEIAENIFNSCGVQNIYFPASITNVTEYTISYLHADDDKVRIYYPLSQEDWMKIYLNGPSGYSDAYNAGADIAANINEFLGGSELDTTEDYLEFHFGVNSSESGDSTENVVDGSDLSYKQEAAEDYVDAETPSYEDLMRYPDSYRTKKIKITVKITEVEPDGIIFDGNIMGTYEGKEIGVVDNRVNKEPKMLEGDTIVIYGYGRGTGTIKEKQGFTTVDSYMIPVIDVRYLEIK